MDRATVWGPNPDHPNPRAGGDGDPASPASDESSRAKPVIARKRTGCRTCRHRRVKCDETKPMCTRCRKAGRTCEWPGSDDPARRRHARRPNATACTACKEKKLKCVGGIQDDCDRCRNLGITCVRHGPSAGLAPGDATRASIARSPTLSSDPISNLQFHHAPDADPAQHHETAAGSVLANVVPSVHIPTGRGLQELVDLYFESVHHFGFFAFIHQPHFNRLIAKGKAPRELTLMMIASAARFAAKPTPETLAKADAWADAAIATTVPLIYQGFGAIQLMTLLLAQHYDLNRGNFSSAWILGANCTRMMQMMSLQSFDRTYQATLPTSLHLSPLLSPEALRRIAWSTFYVDTIVDGGRYGFHVVDEKAYRLQLPCDEQRFFANEAVVTDTLFEDAAPMPVPMDAHLERAPLGMSAHLLRTAALRRRALHFAYRASHKEQTAEQLSAELTELEAHVEEFITTLPRRYHFNSDNMSLHRHRLPTFVLLHVLRHNLFIVVGRAALHIYQGDFAKADLINQIRSNRISHALPIAGLIAEALKAGIIFDPQIGVQAYVALEILLFEPRRLAELDNLVDPMALELMEAIPHLLTVIRDIADRSEFVKQLHIEAVHRLLRCGCTSLLNDIDFVAFRSGYQLVGQDAAEYDFRDFRWAKLERIRRGAKSAANVARDEALLEYNVGVETVAPSVTSSPRLDAIDVNNARGLSSTIIPPVATAAPGGINLPGTDNNSSGNLDGVGLMPLEQPWGGLVENSNQALPVDWLWFLGDCVNPANQTGDPEMFWNQLQQM